MTEPVLLYTLQKSVYKYSRVHVDTPGSREIEKALGPNLRINTRIALSTLEIMTCKCHPKLALSYNPGNYFILLEELDNGTIAELARSWATHFELSYSDSSQELRTYAEETAQTIKRQTYAELRRHSGGDLKLVSSQEYAKSRTLTAYVDAPTWPHGRPPYM